MSNLAASRRPSRGPLAVAAVAALSLALAACSGDDGPDQAEQDDGTIVASAAPERSLTVTGPDDGAMLNAEGVADLQVVVEAQMSDEETTADLDDLLLLLDGEDVTADAQIDGERLEWDPDELEDGDRTISLASASPDDDAAEDDTDADPGDEGDTDEQEEGGPEILQEWAVTVDATPPEIELTEPDGAVIAGQELTVAGTTEPDADVAIGDDEVTAGEDGSFELVLDQAPDGSLELVATDLAGNTSDAEVSLVTVPSRAESPENIRSAHVSFCAWSHGPLIDPIMEKVENGTINAIQLDLKDETGKVGYDTGVEFASTIGADTPDCRVDLEEAVERLHAMDVPVIGRIVAFADPVLARWAWDNGERDMVMQTEGGEMYTGRYSGFSNFASQDVIDYNVALAEEAAAAGVDHILWDYIRKPDGDGARFPGLEGDPQDAIIDFTRQADEAIAPYGAMHGASVYGVSADRPAEVAQNIPAMAEHLDYMAPMIYPSHWGVGEYGVADPLNQPYEMIEATLEVWLEATEGTRARVIPWLEDSQYPVSIGGPDRVTYITEQLQATYDAGIEEWILWDSSVNYTTEALFLPEG